MFKYLIEVIVLFIYLCSVLKVIDKSRNKYSFRRINIHLVELIFKGVNHKEKERDLQLQKLTLQLINSDINFRRLVSAVFVLHGILLLFNYDRI